MAETKIRKGFRLDDGTLVRFIAPLAEGDERGRRIIETYVEKLEFLRRMQENDAQARVASEGAKEATAQAAISKKSAALFEDLIRKIAHDKDVDIDALLASSEVANEVARIPSVELLSSTAINAIVRAVNDNNERLKEAFLTLCDYIQKLVDNVAYYTDEPFPNVPQLDLDFRRTYAVNRITEGGVTAPNTAVCGKAVVGLAVCGTI